MVKEGGTIVNDGRFKKKIAMDSESDCSFSSWDAASAAEGKATFSLWAAGAWHPAVGLNDVVSLVELHWRWKEVV